MLVHTFIINLIANVPEAEQLSLDVAKQLIQSQYNLATIGISALVGIAVLLMAGTWLWNFYLHKRKLEEAIESIKAEITAEANERINNETEKAEKKIEKRVEEKMLWVDGEQARLFAVLCQQRKHWVNAAIWWASAIQNYAKAKENEALRLAVDQLNDALKKCETLKADEKKDIKNSVSFIPNILHKEKEQIEDRLNELPEKIKKKSTKT